MKKAEESLSILDRLHKKRDELKKEADKLDLRICHIEAEISDIDKKIGYHSKIRYDEIFNKDEGALL